MDAPPVDWSVIFGALPNFWRGLQITLMLLAISMSSGLLLSIPLGVLRVSPRRWVSGSVWFYTYVIRGTPLLVQLFMIYFGLAQFEAVRESVAWPLLKSAWFCAWLAFTLNTTAYTTEIVAGALRATPPGELEAARSLGMGTAAIYRRILLPGALRRALPQYGNEVVMMMHATALASTVSIVELTRVARDVYSDHLLPAEAFGTVAVFYFVLTFTLVGIFKLLEQRYLAHLRPKQPERKAG
ncbi:ABC transporter permease [Alsobacter metallidurans]|uniref:ABC transporter permease n=1 Tax=Alsobacter metallidurans TaxID=340221 RepID=A0A917MKK0_9HYPH|nr:ABC transporter permease [Alsobacter metallidurans]GGH24250.1 ABC transporter permease [Alsobacter metallidurans]